MARILYPSLQAPPYAVPAPFTVQDTPVGPPKTRGHYAALIASGQTYDPEPLGTPEFVGPDKWWQPFSERLHAKARLHAALNPFEAYSESAQFEEVVFIDKYLYPFGLPVWHKPALLAGDQPFYMAEPQPEDQDFMSWFQRLSEPKRFPKRLDTGLNPFFVTGAHALGTPFARGYVIC